MKNKPSPRKASTSKAPNRHHIQTPHSILVNDMHLLQINPDKAVNMGREKPQDGSSQKKTAIGNPTESSTPRKSRWLGIKFQTWQSLTATLWNLPSLLKIFLAKLFAGRKKIRQPKGSQAGGPKEIAKAKL